MNKICTSIEQSLKLIELGIDVNTADMYYQNRVGGINYPLPIEYKMGLPLLSQEIAAWSLTALLGLMPDIIEDYVLRIDKVDNEYFIWYDKIGEGWSDAIAHPSSENFVDAAFEMIYWLLENKKL